MYYSGAPTSGPWGSGSSYWNDLWGQEYQMGGGSGDPWGALFSVDRTPFARPEQETHWNTGLMNPPRQSYGGLPPYLAQNGPGYYDEANQVLGLDQEEGPPLPPVPWGFGINSTPEEQQSFMDLLQNRASGAWEKLKYGGDKKFGASDILRWVTTILNPLGKLTGTAANVVGGAVYDWAKQKFGGDAGGLSDFWRSLGADNDDAARKAFMDRISEMQDPSGGPGGNRDFMGRGGDRDLPGGERSGGGDRGPGVVREGPGDPFQAAMGGIYGGYMGNPNIGMPQSWMMPVAGSNVGIPVIQGPSWVGPAFDPEKGY